MTHPSDMNRKPKYLLKSSEIEKENDSLEELMRVAQSLTVYWEIFRVYKTPKEEDKQVLNIDAIENILRLHKKGYNYKAIKRTTGFSEFWIGKVVSRNSVVKT